MSDLEPGGPCVRVVLADDHPVVRAGIRALLQSAPEIQVVGDASNGVEALALILAERPDVAVIDLSMPGINGLELTRRLSADCASVKVITLTVQEDRSFVQPLLQEGARGYVLKRSAAEELVRAIRAVAAGGMYVDPSVAGKIFGDAAASPRRSGAESEAELSPREAHVLKFTAQGFSNKEIAGKLKVSVKTVETYKARASEKTGLRTRAEIVRHGLANGWLEDLATKP